MATRRAKRADKLNDTIFALSSGAAPAAIGIVRISGPHAAVALTTLCGKLPDPRKSSLRAVTGADGEILDRALILWFPGPATATGEDLAEIHCHGGRAVIAAIASALASLQGLRAAGPGEFTRRAFDNGRMDLNAVEGLSDLLAAETQAQRRAALLMTEGHFSRQIEGWRQSLLHLSALTEAALDFSDEDDVPAANIEDEIRTQIGQLRDLCAQALSAPSVQRLRDGVRVVLAGPPNAGKSTLLNSLVGRDVAIVSDIAGTTRDRIEVPAAINGIAFLFTDTAGLHIGNGDVIENIGMERARHAMAAADLILWLGDADSAPCDDVLLVAAQSDRTDRADRPGFKVSALTGEGMDALRMAIQSRAAALLPQTGEVALHDRQRQEISKIVSYLQSATASSDFLIVAEELRLARYAIDRLTGRAGTEDLLDRLFSSFCIGK